MSDKYLTSLLGKDERVIYATRQHWFVLAKNILVEGVAILSIIVLFSVLLVAAKDQTWSQWLVLGYLLLIPAIVSLMIDFFQWFNQKYVVSNWRVIQLSGVINKDVTDSSLEKVNDVKLTQSVFGRVFNFGTVEILTASELGVNKFNMIGDPIHFKTTIVNAKEQLESLGSRPVTTAKSGPMESVDIAGQITRLQELREKGVLSDEEFQRAKQALLAKL